MSFIGGRGMISYHDKYFGMLSSSTGASNATVFHYLQDGDVAWGTFEDGTVRKGVFVATVDAAGVLDLRYAYVNLENQLVTGTSLSTPTVLEDGRIRLHEDFQFTSGDQAKGISYVEEMPQPAQTFEDAPAGRYDGKRFASIANTPNGEVTGDTVFEYHQTGNVVWASYEGGGIRKGMLVAVVDASAGDALDMAYKHVNTRGEIMTGRCHSKPEVLADGRIRLHEQWQWTSGDQSKGESVVEEIGR